MNLHITSRDHVADFHDKDITHLVSIGSKGEAPGYYAHFPTLPYVLRLEFDDVAMYESNVFYAPGFVPPTSADVQELVSFAYGIGCLSSPTNVLYHCSGGISRSTAAAYIVLNVLLGPGSEEECLKRVHAARPCAVPNELMVMIADKLLERNGAMLKPVEVFNREYRIDIMETDEDLA